MKAWHEAHRNILPLPELSEWTLQQLFAKAGKRVTNTLGIMLEILSNYPWTRLSVRIIGAIKRQLFHMVTHVFDDSNLSKEIFALDTWRAVICSLGHGHKHMLTILPTIWRPGFRLTLTISLYLELQVYIDDNCCQSASIKRNFTVKCF